MVGAEQAQRIYVQIALGTSKADYPWPLDDEASVFWDEVEASVAAIRNRGDDLDIAEVTEIPDLPPWVKEAPAAPDTPPPPGVVNPPS